MYPSQRDFLRHIQDECRFILKATNGKSKEEVLSDEILTRALVRSLEIIGEASKKLAPEFKALHSGIEWRKMGATRDIMIHHYFGIDYDILWSIITDKIEPLETFLAEILNSAD